MVLRKPADVGVLYSVPQASVLVASAIIVVVIRPWLTVVSLEQPDDVDGERVAQRQQSGRCHRKGNAGTDEWDQADDECCNLDHANCLTPPAFEKRRFKAGHEDSSSEKA